jgi:hypothetical protein
MPRKPAVSILEKKKIGKTKDDPKLFWKSPDGTQFEVPAKIIQSFPRIQMMIQKDSVTIIELTGTSKAIMQDLERYFQLEADQGPKESKGPKGPKKTKETKVVILEPLRGYGFSESIQPKPWAEFCQTLNRKENDLRHLLVLVKIAQNLQLKVLWQLLCACIASRIKAKDLTEIRRLLKISE